jgi:hypothetical protein
MGQLVTVQVAATQAFTPDPGSETITITQGGTTYGPIAATITPSVGPATSYAFQITVPFPLPGGLVAGTATATPAFTEGGLAVNPLGVPVALVAGPPAITSLSPPQVGAGSSTTAVTITGSGFWGGSTVQVGADTGIPALIVSATQIVALVPAADIAASGPVTVIVSNAGGSASATLNVVGSAPSIAMPVTFALDAGGFFRLGTNDPLAWGTVTDANNNPVDLTAAATIDITILSGWDAGATSTTILTGAPAATRSSGRVSFAPPGSLLAPAPYFVLCNIHWTDGTSTAAPTAGYGALLALSAAPAA